MTNEEAGKFKAMDESEFKSRLAHGAGATFGECAQQPQVAAPTLRERIRSQRLRAQLESRRLEQLHELEYLLDKHHEVARILELIEAVRD